jgi:hypothetical protein
VTLAVVLITLLLLGIVVLVLGAPLRAARPRDAAAEADSIDQLRAADATIARDELEAAREAKYREIRDAELDYRTGKLSREDYDTVDGELRAEAIEILNRLDGERERSGAGSEPSRTVPRDGDGVVEDELNGVRR